MISYTLLKVKTWTDEIIPSHKPPNNTTRLMRSTSNGYTTYTKKESVRLSILYCIKIQKQGESSVEMMDYNMFYQRHTHTHTHRPTHIHLNELCDQFTPAYNVTYPFNHKDPVITMRIVKNEIIYRTKWDNSQNIFINTHKRKTWINFIILHNKPCTTMTHNSHGSPPLSLS